MPAKILLAEKKLQDQFTREKCIDEQRTKIKCDICGNDKIVGKCKCCKKVICQKHGEQLGAFVTTIMGVKGLETGDYLCINCKEKTIGELQNEMGE